MLEWLNANTGAMQVALSAVMVVVWLFYLQLFFMSFIRQRRSEILISMGAGAGLDARCFIANLGLEPIYVQELLLWVETPEGEFTAAITDRHDMTEEQLKDPRQATNQGPLKSGDSYAAGRFGELARLAFRSEGLDEGTAVRSLELTVVAVHASSAMLIAARRRYDLIENKGVERLEPRTLATRQVRWVLERYRLRRQLRQNLANRRG